MSQGMTTDTPRPVPASLRAGFTARYLVCRLTEGTPKP